MAAAMFRSGGRRRNADHRAARIFFATFEVSALVTPQDNRGWVASLEGASRVAVVAIGLAIAACGRQKALPATEKPDATQDAEVPSAHPEAPAVASAANPPPPANRHACPTSGLSSYLLSSDTQLFRFDPPTLVTRPLGPLHCPAKGIPWTLTVASNGALYLMFTDWHVYKVDPESLACAKTAYDPGPLLGSGDTGLTIARHGDAEAMYVSGFTSHPVLVRVDLDSFKASEVGPLAPTPGDMALDIRADAFGHIFGLGDGGALVTIDPTTGKVVAHDETPFRSVGAWALLTWDANLYFFSNDVVSQYDRRTRKLTERGRVGIRVVGASSAPCVHVKNEEDARRPVEGEAPQ
jgi:hypothetical protein